MLTFKSNLNERQKANDRLVEAVTYMTSYDRKVKKALIRLLMDDGRGHHHAKYAERLKNFFIKVVPTDSKDVPTASVSFSTRTVYINEGFLLNQKSDPKQPWPDAFYQLSTVIRHELLHNLLMHQVRMMQHIGENKWSRIRMSLSIHSLLNIVEDFEISNKKYNDEDKETMRHLWLNGKTITALVTEDYRVGWTKLSVEEMYEKVKEELDKLQQELISYPEYALTKAKRDPIWSEGAKAAAKYMFDEPSSINGELTDFIDGKTFIRTGPGKLGETRFSNLIKGVQEVLLGIKSAILDSGVEYSRGDIGDLIKKITESSPLKELDLVSVHDGTIICTLYTPEEKYMAKMALNTLLGNTQENAVLADTYDRVFKTLSDEKYTDDDLQSILDALDD